MKRSLVFLTYILVIQLVALHAAEKKSPAPQVKSFDILSYGAVGDGQTINTTSIQKAIDACFAAGGGRVVVPSGVFMTGSLRLKSNVVLRIEKDAILRSSPKIADYGLESAEQPYGTCNSHRPPPFQQCLIFARDAKEIGIEGLGTIDGQGGIERKVFPNKEDAQQRVPMLIRFERCKNVKISGITLLDPVTFTTYFWQSQEIQIEGVTVRSRKSRPGNAFVIVGSRRVRISGCDIDAGDDGITLQNLMCEWPNEDIEISNCRITSKWCAVRLGPESFGATRRVNMHDCTFTTCQGGIKIESNEGQTYEDLSFSNIQMTKVCQPIMVLASRFAFSKYNQFCRPPVGHIRNVRFEHIKAAIYFEGDVGRSKADDPFSRLCAAVTSAPGGWIENVAFSDIDFSYPGGGTAEQAARLDVGELLEAFDWITPMIPFDGELPASALYLRHVKGVRLENVRFSVEKPDARAFIAGDDVQGLTMKGVVASAPAPVPGLAKLADVKNVTEKNCLVKCGVPVPVMVTPTQEELRRLAELRTRSVKLDREFQQKADQIDAAAKKSVKSK